MALLRLNYDVLFSTLPFAQAEGCLIPMMQTCRTLQRAGGLLLLQDEIVVKHTAQLVSFCQFMLADDNRFRSLRELTLSISVWDFPRKKEPCAFLTHVLQRAVYLEILTIENSNFLDAFLEVSDAITQLPMLKELHMADGLSRDKNKLHDMLVQIQAPIRTLGVSFHPDAEPRFQTKDAIDTLEGVAPHLEDLYISYATFFVIDGPVYPRLKQLTTHETCSIHDCDVLLRAFPNLRYLEIGDSLPVWDEVELEDQRLQNRRTQDNLRWEYLSYLEGALGTLYALALQCPVTTLDVHSAYRRNSKEMLSAVIRDVTPTNLRLQLDDDLPYHLYHLVDILSASYIRLRGLAVEVCISSGTEDLMVETIFDCIMDALRATKIEYIRLTLHWLAAMTDYDFYMESRVNDPTNPLVHPPSPHPTALALQQLDRIVFSRQIMDQVRSVKSIVFDWDHASNSRHFAAVIEEAAGVRYVKVLGTEEAQELRHQVEGTWCFTTTDV